MSIKKYLAIAKSPKMTFHYIGKYGKHYASSARYSIRRFCHVNEYASLNRKIRKSIPSKAEVKVFARRSLEEIDVLLQATNLHQVVMNQADKCMNNEFLILNTNREGMFDAQKGHYRWHDDFFENYTYKMSHFSRARKVNSKKGVDVKVPWETSRMQYLFSLALAYRSTKDVKYASKVKHIILDFMECNDLDEGPNWNVSMEVGIRIANIILAVEFIQDSEICDEDFYHRFALCVYAHQQHILKNLENIAGKTSNHFLGDLLGLAASVAVCSDMPNSAKVKQYVIESLHHEISHQVQSDGSDFEGSTSYQRLVGELLCFAILAAEQIGFDLLSEERALLAKMAEFEQSIQMPNGLAPQIGDNDSGRVFQLTEEETRDHTSCINLLYSLGQRIAPKDSTCNGFECFWSKDLKPNSELRLKSVIEHFENFRAVRYRGENLYLFFTAGTPERNGMPGHAHNDLLSFVISADEEYIVDPGSGEYTGHPDIRNQLRTTLSHSTIRVNDAEQRALVSDSLFQWYSGNETRVNIEETEDTYRLSGEYHNEQANYTHHRMISVSKDERCVTVQDKVTSMGTCCTMNLPIYPGIAVEMEEENIHLVGKQYVMVLSGSWKMSVIDGLYSPQYHETVNTKYVHCESSKENNVLTIEIRSK